MEIQIPKAGKSMIFFFSQYLSQIHFNLIVSDQPNLILDSGSCASLDSNCHYQIIHCKVNFRIPPHHRLRKMWHYNKANTAAIQRNMSNSRWLQHFNLNSDINWQVKTFTDIFLNIMSNFIPNEIKTIISHELSWITRTLKTMVKRKNRLFKNYKKHRYKEEDNVRLETFRIECQLAVGTAKLCYLTNLENRVNDPSTSQKSYWKIINGVMNKCRTLKYYPFLLRTILF